MTEVREKMLDRMIAIYGFENHWVIAFAEACENEAFSDGLLELCVLFHEESPCLD